MSDSIIERLKFATPDGGKFVATPKIHSHIFNNSSSLSGSQLAPLATVTPPTPNSMPSLAKMAGNLAGTGIDVLKAAVTQQQITADDDTYNERLKICEGCEFLETPSFRCSKCGCWMKTKAKILPAKCPVDKWDSKPIKP